jgi:SH3-like domain-containing protein
MFLTIVVGIGLTLGVFFIVPMIENGNVRIPSVSRNQAAPAQARFMLVSSDALNVRKGPSANNDVVGQLKKGARVQVLNSSGQWWRIRSGNIEGYVNSQYLINEEKAPSAPVSLLSLPKPVRLGTTRDADFQRDYEEAVREYDARMRGVPSGLILPGGMTVEEAVSSGRVSGK